MSKVDVIMPQMGESIAEGTLTKWLKQIGDAVDRDEDLFEISTDKVDADIPSPVAGTLVEILVEEGATVEVNTVVARIDTEGGAAAPPEPHPAAVGEDRSEQPLAVLERDLQQRAAVVAEQVEDLVDERGSCSLVIGRGCLRIAALGRTTAAAPPLARHATAGRLRDPGLEQ